MMVQRVRILNGQFVLWTLFPCTSSYPKIDNNEAGICTTCQVFLFIGINVTCISRLSEISSVGYVQKYKPNVICICAGGTRRGVTFFPERLGEYHTSSMCEIPYV